MLPSKNRIPRHEFPSYKMKGIRAFSPLFTAVFYKKEGSEHVNSRVSIVVSKKISKKAVVRNNIRRKFYDLMREFLDKPIYSFDVVFYPKSEVKEVNPLIIKGEIEKALKQVRLL